MKEQILEALLGLMEIVPYHEISVRVICESAGISRPTFYNHFHSKEDAVRWFVHNDFMTSAYPVIRFRQEASATLAFFAYLRRHRDFYLHLFDVDHGLLLRSCLESTYTDVIQDFEEDILPGNAKLGSIDPILFAKFSSGALASLITYWVETGMSIPEEKFSAVLAVLLQSPLNFVFDHYFSSNPAV